MQGHIDETRVQSFFEITNLPGKNFFSPILGVISSFIFFVR